MKALDCGQKLSILGNGGWSDSHKTGCSNAKLHCRFIGLRFISEFFKVLV